MCQSRDAIQTLTHVAVVARVTHKQGDQKEPNCGGVSLSQGNKSTLLCHCKTVDVAVG